MVNFVQKHTLQQYREEERQIDYSERDNHYIRCLKAVEEVMDIDAYILDYCKEHILYMTRRCSFRHAFPGESWGEGPFGYELFNRVLCPQDMEKVETVHRLGYDFYFDLPVERRYHGCESLDIRIRDAQGRWKLVNHKVSLLDMTDDGRIRLGMCVIGYPTSKTPGTFYFKMSDNNAVYEYIEKSQKFVQVKTQRLTSKSEKVLELASRGKTEAEIAALLDISVHTVKYHKRTILRQLNVRNTTEAVQWMNSQKKLSSK